MMDQTEFDRLTKQSEESIKARVICDSVNPDGCRLTTFEWTYPRFIHSEIMTHRKLSRNSASSRAIPLHKMIQRVQNNPVFPLHWGKNEKGMQATTELTMEEKLVEAQQWIDDRNWMIASALKSMNRGMHKQLGNRKLELWMWITVIVSATNFENLFALRCHPAAEPHFQNLAYKIRNAYDASTPFKMKWGEWHLPLFGSLGHGDPDNDFMIEKENWQKVSAGRCARVSYLTHEGKRDPAEDIRLFEQLSTHKPMHASPLEHPAQAINPLELDCMGPGEHAVRKIDWGNYDAGWWQLRKQMPGECVTKRAN